MHEYKKKDLTELNRGKPKMSEAPDLNWSFLARSVSEFQERKKGAKVLIIDSS